LVLAGRSTTRTIYRPCMIPLYQLCIRLRSATRIVEVHRAEVSRELQSAAPHVVRARAPIVAELEEGGARFEERGVVVPRQRQIARLLEFGSRALAARAEQKGGEDCRCNRS